MNTIIKTSLKGLWASESLIISELSNMRLNFDISQYKVVWGGQIEEGLKLVFFGGLNRFQIKDIHSFMSTFEGYGCFYLECSTFKGCVLEYLGGQSCGVPGEWLNNPSYDRVDTGKTTINEGGDLFFKAVSQNTY